MQIPRSQDELRAIVESRAPESLNREYKRSISLTAAHRKELSKDVSSFANSDGGLLIYGVEEEGHVPQRLDGGVSRSDVTRETIEQLLLANISPRVDGILISQIDGESGQSYFAIQVAQSHRAPHQDRITNKYYKRHNFVAVPMEDYELADLRGRSRLAAPLVTFDVETRHGTLFLFRISNKGELPAEAVSFDFAPQLTWLDAEGPPAIVKNGISHLPPGREYVVFYYPIPAALAADNKVCTDFTVTISYFHPTAKSRLSEVYPISLRDYLGTWPSYAPIEELGKVIEKGLGEVASELKAINRHLGEISASTTATGLRLSVSTLQALSLLAKGHDPIGKLDPQGQDGAVFQEVLGLPLDLSWRIARHFWRTRSLRGLTEVPGVSEDVIGAVRLRFSVEDEI